MSKDIFDYLHFYLGCECFTYSGKGVLQEFGIEGRWYVKLANGGGTVGNINDKNKPCPEESKEAFPNGYPPDSILKPILRKLESMTLDELREWCKLALTLSGETVDDKVLEESLPDALADVKEYGLSAFDYSDENFYQVPELFHYLLSRGFWLFGNDWFDEGLIIDKDTLKG